MTRPRCPPACPPAVQLGRSARCTRARATEASTWSTSSGATERVLDWSDDTHRLGGTWWRSRAPRHRVPRRTDLPRRERRGIRLRPRVPSAGVVPQPLPQALSRDQPCTADRLYLASTGFDSVLEIRPGDGSVLAGVDACATSRRRKLEARSAPRIAPAIPAPTTPRRAGGPAAPPTRRHINNVWPCDDGAIFACGTRLVDAVAASDGPKLRASTRAPPFGTHNTRPFRDGVLFNHTESDRIVYADARRRGLRVVRAAHLPERGARARGPAGRPRAADLRPGPHRARRLDRRRRLIAGDDHGLRHRHRRAARDRSTSRWTCATPFTASRSGPSTTPGSMTDRTAQRRLAVGVDQHLRDLPPRRPRRPRRAVRGAAGIGRAPGDRCSGVQTPRRRLHEDELHRVLQHLRAGGRRRRRRPPRRLRRQRCPRVTLTAA